MEQTMPESLARNALRVIFATALIALIAACASTQLVSSWVDPNYQGGPLKKLIIFVASKDDAVRRNAEDQAAASLPASTKGVASYKLFPNQSDLNPQNQENIKAVMVRDGFDGALVTRVLSKDQNNVYVPPQTYLVPGAGAPVAGVPYGSFYGYYGYAYSYAYVSPGYTYQQTTYMIESILYRLPAGNVIWTATTESVNPDSRQEVVNELIRIIGSSLKKDGLVSG
jgi:hypothetical protein